MPARSEAIHGALAPWLVLEAAGSLAAGRWAEPRPEAAGSRRASAAEPSAEGQQSGLLALTRTCGPSVPLLEALRADRALPAERAQPPLSSAGTLGAIFGTPAGGVSYTFEGTPQPTAPARFAAASLAAADAAPTRLSLDADAVRSPPCPAMLPAQFLSPPTSPGASASRPTSAAPAIAGATRPSVDPLVPAPGASHDYHRNYIVQDAARRKHEIDVAAHHQLLQLEQDYNAQVASIHGQAHEHLQAAERRIAWEKQRRHQDVLQQEHDQVYPIQQHAAREKALIAEFACQAIWASLAKAKAAASGPQALAGLDRQAQEALLQVRMPLQEKRLLVASPAPLQGH